MTISTVTNETIAGVANLKAGYTLGHADVAILKALAADLLAVREAQSVPVAWQAESKVRCNRMTTLNKEVAADWAFKGFTVTPLYTAPPAPAVPAGFKLVPVESNDAWAERYCELTNKHPDGWLTTYLGDGAVTITFREKSKREIDAMLAAAPNPTK